jgi:hypothetical protein
VRGAASNGRPYRETTASRRSSPGRTSLIATLSASRIGVELRVAAKIADIGLVWEIHGDFRFVGDRMQ